MDHFRSSLHHPCSPCRWNGSIEKWRRNFTVIWCNKNYRC